MGAEQQLLRSKVSGVSSNLPQNRRGAFLIAAAAIHERIQGEPVFMAADAAELRRLVLMMEYPRSWPSVRLFLDPHKLGLAEKDVLEVQLLSESEDKLESHLFDLMSTLFECRLPDGREGCLRVSRDTCCP
jgi:hypothetical protein